MPQPSSSAIRRPNEETPEAERCVSPRRVPAICACAAVLLAGAASLAGFDVRLAISSPLLPSSTELPCRHEPLFPNPCALPAITEAQAKADLAAAGYSEVNDLEPVGSYWEGEGRIGSREVTVYVFGDGRVLHSPPMIGEP
jgi:hypothetical protein